MGLSEIHIKGTPENYQELIRKVEEMAEDLQLHWWAIELIPVLEQFLQAVQGKRKCIRSSLTLSDF